MQGSRGVAGSGVVAGSGSRTVRHARARWTARAQLVKPRRARCVERRPGGV